MLIRLHGKVYNAAHVVGWIWNDRARTVPPPGRSAPANRVHRQAAGASVSAPSWMNRDAFGRPVYLYNTAHWPKSPSEAERHGLERDDLAKVAFAYEALWVAVVWRWTYAGQLVYSGALTNVPLTIRWDHGERVEFFPENVIETWPDLH